MKKIKYLSVGIIAFVVLVWIFFAQLDFLHQWIETIDIEIFLWVKNFLWITVLLAVIYGIVKFPITAFIGIITISIVVWSLVWLDFLPQWKWIEMIFGKISIILGTVAAVVAIIEFFKLKEKLKQEIEKLTKLVTIAKKIREKICKFICESVCSYTQETTQETVFIDFAKEDEKLAKDIENFLRKEGIPCDSTTDNSENKLLKNKLLENKLLESRAIVTLLFETPESWIMTRIRNAIYRKEFASKVIVCTNKSNVKQLFEKADKNNAKQLFEKAEILYSTELDYKKLLSVVKDKLKKS
jgi:hypothetical protein